MHVHGNRQADVRSRVGLGLPLHIRGNVSETDVFFPNTLPCSHTDSTELTDQPAFVLCYMITCMALESLVFWELPVTVIGLQQLRTSHFYEDCLLALSERRSQFVLS